MKIKNLIKKIKEMAKELNFKELEVVGKDCIISSTGEIIPIVKKEES